MKIDNMADVFLKSAEHKKNTVLTLVPPISYNLNLKYWPRCQKFAEHLSFHMKYFDLDLKEKSERKNFISSKKTPGLFRVKGRVTLLWLKVRLIPNDFSRRPTLLPKNKQTNSTLLPVDLFCSFFGRNLRHITKLTDL